MHDDLTMPSVDRDGALAETAGRLGDTRAGFLAKGALASGALVGGGAALGLLAPAAHAQDDAVTDTDIGDRRGAAVRPGGGRPRGRARDRAAKRARDRGDRQADVRLRRRHGRSRDVPGHGDRARVDGGAGLQGPGATHPLPRDPGRRAVHPLCGGKHTAWVRLIAGRVPIPVPLDKPLTRQNVLNKLARTGFIVAA